MSPLSSRTSDTTIEFDENLQPINTPVEQEKEQHTSNSSNISQSPTPPARAPRVATDLEEDADHVTRKSAEDEPTDPNQNKSAPATSDSSSSVYYSPKGEAEKLQQEQQQKRDLEAQLEQLSTYTEEIEQQASENSKRLVRELALTKTNRIHVKIAL